MLNFRGGIHPPENKWLTEGKPTVDAKLPKKVVIPLSQHTGAPCKAIVAVEQEVKKGQRIGEPEGYVSSPVHSSISGKVISIGNFPHPSGKDSPSVVIESDERDEWFEGIKENPDYLSLNIDELRKIVMEAGIVGLGGAAFPTHVKLSPPKEKKIETVIINGAECEPYLTSDHRIMVERPGDIIEGLKIIMKTLGVYRGYVGIEDNKPDAIGKLNEVASAEPNIGIVALKVKYPQGAEKQLIKAILGSEVPSGGLPMDVGVVVQNVGTAVAIYDACRYGRPLIERVVTVTGKGVKEPKNLRVRIGTLFTHLLDECGGFRNGPGKIIAGGPMMGIAQSSTEIPVIKGTSGIVVLTRKETERVEYRPCFRCGRCIEACPMGLQPSILSILIEKSRYQEAKENHLFDCFECGSCAYVCPAKRPMVQFMKLGKLFVLARKG
ncbi:MAG: electron transport complex subunit RsxC [Nitrospirota bacterium]